MMPYEQYKKSFYYVMKDDETWQSLTDKEKEQLVKYTFENQEVVADVLHMIAKEKELN